MAAQGPFMVNGLFLDAGSPNHFKADLCTACNEDCVFCCFACLCPHCAACDLRRRAINNDLRNYRCCQQVDYCCGGCEPTSACGCCSPAHCPEFCLCAEACCCLVLSIAGTRAVVQEQNYLANTRCEACCLHCLAVTPLAGGNDSGGAQGVTCCQMQQVNTTMAACLQTQAKVELDIRDGLVPPPPGRVSRHAATAAPQPMLLPTMMAGPGYYQNAGASLAPYPGGAAAAYQPYPTGGYMMMMVAAPQPPANHAPTIWAPPEDYPGHPQHTQGLKY